jgi:predicted ester cyclase
MMPELTQLRDFAKRYTGAWCSQNASRVAAFLALNGSLSVNGTPAVGRAAVTEVAQGFMTAFPDLQLLMDDILIQGDRAVYHWTFIGTNTGPGGTGHGVRFSGYEVWKFGEDGLIAESQGHFDAADYQRQLECGVGASH